MIEENTVNEETNCAETLEISGNEIESRIDINECFKGFEKIIPQFEEIRKCALQFGDAHRYLLQKMIIESCMVAKKFNILFIEYIVTMQLNRNPCVVKYIQVNIDQLKDLTKTIVKTINEATCEDQKSFGVMHPTGMRLVINSEEKLPRDWVTLICEIQNSELIGENSVLSKAERELFFSIIDELFENNGSIPRKWIDQQIGKQNEKLEMSHVKCEKFLSVLFNGNWLHTADDGRIIEIGPRTTAEMEPYIRHKLANIIKYCELCHKIITRTLRVAECKQCNLLMHFNCFKSALEYSKEDGVECQKCSTIIQLNDVEKEMKTRCLNTSSDSDSDVNDEDD